MNVRVRIAPSPTGHLHVGTARTALFNYLYAKRHAGAFILRIEDTDQERSQADYIRNIYDGLNALGLSWDEGPDVGGPYGPYIQSERLSIYRPYAIQLVEAGLAYYDFTPESELTRQRELAAERKVPFIYRSQALPDAEQASRLASGEPYSIRFRIPRELMSVTVDDEIRGKVTFDTSLIGDFVILKSDGMPSYNFAVVVDDALMKISHVIRGEDHLSNTPKQILLYQALGWAVPTFAHLGMILAPDRSKLSKRHGATAVSDYIGQGYLPEAFNNFLALLGWSDPQGEEILTLQQLSERFALDRISHSGAIFDIDKLNWMNGHYIRELSLPELKHRLNPMLASLDSQGFYNDEQWHLLLSIVRDGFVTLADAPAQMTYFFGDVIEIEPEIQRDVLATADSEQVLTVALTDWLPTVDFGSLETVQAGIKALLSLLKPLKTKTVLWAIRAATTGKVQGADLASVLFLLGSQRIETRLKHALDSIKVAR